jgi:hypothetical protein
VIPISTHLTFLTPIQCPVMSIPTSTRRPSWIPTKIRSPPLEVQQCLYPHAPLHPVCFLRLNRPQTPVTDPAADPACPLHYSNLPVV